MSSCCLIHPQRLLQRFKLSIKTIKFLQKNCAIFERILLDEYEQFERLSRKYFMQYNPIVSQFNQRLECLSRWIYEIQCLTMKCSIWLKTSSMKSIHNQLKSAGKQFATLEKFVDQHWIGDENKFTRKFWNDFTHFQTTYHQLALQMDSIESEHMKLYLQSVQLFSFENHHSTNSISSIDVEQYIQQWKEKNQFHIKWLPNEHLMEKSSSDIDIKPIDDYSSRDTYAYESNLSWSFITPQTAESTTDTNLNLSPQSTQDSFVPINRVRLAIEAIERNSQDFPRGRKS